MIQGFNQGGQRAIGAIKLEITMGDTQSTAWMHVIDAKTSYNLLLGIPWIHENKVVPSTYYQCLKYNKDGVEKKIVDDDKPFAEAEAYFADAKFYLKNRIVKEARIGDITKARGDNIVSKRAEVASDEYKVTIEACQVSKAHKKNVAIAGKKIAHLLRYVPKVKKDEGESSSLQKVALRELTLPIKQIDTIKLFAKVGYDPNEPSKLGKLPPEAIRKANTMKNREHVVKQSREGLGNKQPPPVRISIRRASGEVLKVKTRTVVHTRERDEDEESVGSSYHITANEEQYTSSLRKVDEYLGDSSWCGHISFNDGDPQEDEDVEDAPAELEEGIKMTVDALKEVNLGTTEDSRPTYVSALLTTDEESTYVELLKEYRDVFAWSYKEMPGLDPKVAVHHLAVKKGARPVKQAQRCYRPELIPSIKAEKKNGQIRVCVDFRDLNNACPKEEFPLPIPELMIDATTGYEAMSFIDGSSGYNQIRMAQKDEELTTFRTPKGIYCYKVMPFGLKNAGATYQRAIQNIFDDILHKNVECYVDDLVVKSRKRGDHLQDLRMVFE
uniref:Reverse transcriptase domain-containing protein n=1 Tax=Nicotiana tabacum TaxID=4097 RepID=A0A1S4CV63_TOBAC|nr:PREDICTED: uncharacterized protein LOC107822917 [Nicotiana tabacum]